MLLQFKDVYISKPRLSFQDYPDMENSNLTYFFSGCQNKCPGCQNANLINDTPENIDDFRCYRPKISDRKNLGSIFEEVQRFADSVLEDIQQMNRGLPYIVFQGGDPLYQKNELFTRLFVNEIATNPKYKDSIKLCIYTGFVMIDIEEYFGEITIDSDKENPIRIHTDIDEIGRVLPFIKSGSYDQNDLNPADVIGKKNNKMVFASKNQKLFKYDPELHEYLDISIDGVADLEL